MTVTSNSVVYNPLSLTYAAEVVPQVVSVTPSGGKNGDLITVSVHNLPSNHIGDKRVKRDTQDEQDSLFGQNLRVMVSTQFGCYFGNLNNFLMFK